jgi:hypothetical protein
MRTRIKLALLGLPVLVAGGALALRPSEAPPPVEGFTVEEPPGPAATAGPPGPKVARLQALALRSCQCERQHEGKKDKAACWRPFYAAVAPVEPEEESFSLCGEPSRRAVELRTGEEIVTRYVHYTATFCTSDEAKIAQAAYDKADRRRRADPRAPDPDTVLATLAEKFARGDRLQTARRDVGCTTG